MKKLLKTLYVTTPDSYLFCRNENICVKIGGEDIVERTLLQPHLRAGQRQCAAEKKAVSSAG